MTDLQRCDGCQAFIDPPRLSGLCDDCLRTGGVALAEKAAAQPSMMVPLSDAVRAPTLPGTAGTVAARQQAFDEFHKAHPQVYRELVRRSRLMIERDQRFGIRTLWESMRWDFWIAASPQPFKLNNNHVSFYARLVMAQEPDLADVFNIRDTE